MLSVTHIINILLYASTALCACAPPSYGRDNAQCNTGDFNGCVPAKSIELGSLCNGDPALESACLQQASLRANKECGAYCMDVVDCKSCLKSIELLGLGQDACTHGDMMFCNCWSVLLNGDVIVLTSGMRPYQYLASFRVWEKNLARKAWYRVRKLVREVPACSCPFMKIGLITFFFWIHWDRNWRKALP